MRARLGQRGSFAAALLTAACLALSAGSAWAAGPDLIVTNQGNVNLTPSGTANVAAFTVGTGGALTSFTGSPFTLSGGGYPYGPAVTPDNRFLYVADQMSSVYPYTLGSGSLRAGSPVAIGTGTPEPAINLISPDGHRLNVAAFGTEENTTSRRTTVAEEAETYLGLV